MIYLDNAATTKVCDAAADIAYKMMLESYGNPSSTHAAGRIAKKALDTARKQIAQALGKKLASDVFESDSAPETRKAMKSKDFMAFDNLACA